MSKGKIHLITQELNNVVQTACGRDGTWDDGYLIHRWHTAAHGNIEHMMTATYQRARVTCARCKKVMMNEHA